MMKLTALVLTLSTLLFAGCGGEPTAAGTYKLDPQTLVDAMKAAMPPLPEGTPAEAKKVMEEQIAKATADMEKAVMNLELNADMTFAISGEMPAPQGKITGKGTWVLEGEKLTLNSTHTNGEPKAETKSGTLKGDTITLTEEQGPMKMSMVFNKQ